jgi:hypothetical protein
MAMERKIINFVGAVTWIFIIFNLI